MLTSQSLSCFAFRYEGSSATKLSKKFSAAEGLLEELIVQDAPCLERLFHCGYVQHHDIHISVICAPKLRMIGRLTDMLRRLKLGTTVFKVNVAFVDLILISTDSAI